MESESEIHSPEQQRWRRTICDGCDRPAAVCLCHVIPNPPIQTLTRIVILQHPHESRHKLTTTPLITRSLSNATFAVARRLTRDILRRLIGESDHLPRKIFYLFPPSPSTPAVTLSELKRSNQLSSNGAVLIAFDATWKHAKEMVRASEGLLSEISTRVSLDGFDSEVEGGSIYESELVLRKEPCGGCVSTLEAVARWLGAAEDGGGAAAAEVEGKLIEVLREMVKLQAQFLKPMNPRPKLLKKKKKNGLVDQELEKETHVSL
ncbi:tRNA-uridine aminocarboxypropyltransferase 2 [Linum perenne]